LKFYCGPSTHFVAKPGGVPPTPFPSLVRAAGPTWLSFGAALLPSRYSSPPALGLRDGARDTRRESHSLVTAIECWMVKRPRPGETSGREAIVPGRTNGPAAFCLSLCCDERSHALADGDRARRPPRRRPVAAAGLRRAAPAGRGQAGPGEGG